MKPEKIMLHNNAPNPPSKGVIKGVIKDVGLYIPKTTSTAVIIDNNNRTPQIFCVFDLNLIKPLKISNLCA